MSHPAGTVARSARKLVLARLRTRPMVFTVLLALSEVHALAASLPRQPGLRQTEASRLLWFLSAARFSAVSQRRYRRAARPFLHKSPAWCTKVFLKSSDSRFRECVRMSRPPFHVVLDLRRTHSADLFMPRRDAAQIPLELQLALTLCQLGCYGKAVRLNAAADCVGVYPGVVVKTIRRVVTSLRRLAPLYVKWPNAAEREAIARYERGKFRFSGCIGATGGALLPLAYQSALQPWGYYDRKGRYSLNAVVNGD